MQPRQLHSLASAAGVMHESAQGTEIVAWLKTTFRLGHGLCHGGTRVLQAPGLVVAIEDCDEETDMRHAQMVEPHTEAQPSPAARVRRWPERLGWVLSGLVIVFFLVDALGKILRVPQVLAGSQDLEHPLLTEFPSACCCWASRSVLAPEIRRLGAIYLTASSRRGGRACPNRPPSSRTSGRVERRSGDVGGIELRRPACWDRCWDDTESTPPSSVPNERERAGRSRQVRR